MASSSLKNHFLVAQEELTDSNFGRSVVFIFEHGPEGAAGVVINKPSKLTIEELSDKIYSSKEQWGKDVANFRSCNFNFPNLPYLQLGSHIITETNAIEYFII